jgi:hypothetical protein
LVEGDFKSFIDYYTLLYKPDNRKGPLIPDELAQNQLL